jgi:hypothetical protein
MARALPIAAKRPGVFDSYEGTKKKMEGTKERGVKSSWLPSFFVPSCEIIFPAYAGMAGEGVR